MAEPSNIIKFGKAKKAIARAKKEAQAQENRVKFGRTKAQKIADDSQKTKARKTVDAHRIKDAESSASPNKD